MIQIMSACFSQALKDWCPCLYNTRNKKKKAGATLGQSYQTYHIGHSYTSYNCNHHGASNSIVSGDWYTSRALSKSCECARSLFHTFWFSTSHRKIPWSCLPTSELPTLAFHSVGYVADACHLIMYLSQSTSRVPLREEWLPCCPCISLEF